MQTALIVNCAGFTLEHCVYLLDNKSSMQPIQLPTSEIAGYATNAGVNKIYLRGQKDYCLGIKEEISKQLALEYNNNNIEIEVM